LPPGKVISEKTGNCINEKKQKPKDCPPGKVISEKTGNCINAKKKK
jgi:hypothetical protein